MSSFAEKARLQYLYGSSRHLSKTALTVSATLGAAYTQASMRHDSTISETQSREICGYCGNFLLPGRSCRIKVAVRNEHSRALTKQKIRTKCKASKKTEKVLVYTCTRCDRNIKYPLENPPEIVLPMTTGALSIAPSHAYTNQAIAVSGIGGSPELELRPSTNSSSKTRAKLRKQGGLLAILAKSKAGVSSAADPGFGLMDFLKSD